MQFELQDAPEPKQSKMLALIQQYDIRVLETSKEADHLADAYIRHGIIPERFRFGSTHIACASVYGLDYVLSYNFKHINRTKTKLLTERINRDEGYGSVIICTAKEALEDE